MGSFLLEAYARKQSFTSAERSKLVALVIDGILEQFDRCAGQLYDTFNGIFLLDITDHYQIFSIVPINCPQKRIRVKFRDHSRKNKAKLELERYVNNHVQITQDVSSNTNNFCSNLFVIYSNCCPIKEKVIFICKTLQAVDL